MKKTVFAICLSVMIVSLASCGVGYWICELRTSNDPVSPWEPPRDMRVSGAASSELTIEYAVINATVEVNDPTSPVAAKVQSDEDVRALLTACESMGVARTEVDGSKVSVGAVQEWNKEREQRIKTGYQAKRSLTITLKNLDKLDEVLTRLIGTPSVAIDSVAFGSTQSEKAYADALRKAVEVARTRAQALIEAAGLELGDIRDISEEFEPGSGVFMERAMEYPVVEGVTIEKASSFTKNTLKMPARVSVTFAVTSRQPGQKP